MNRKKGAKAPAGAETRIPDWEAEVARLKIEFVAYEEKIAIQQEMLKGLARQAKEWGLDIEKVTRVSRDAFDRITQAAGGDGKEVPSSKGGAR